MNPKDLRKWSRLEVWEIDKFEAWAVQNGWSNEPTQGGTEILRLRKGDRWAIFYQRTKRTRLATMTETGARLVACWNLDRRPPSALEMWSDALRKKDSD